MALFDEGCKNSEHATYSAAGSDVSLVDKYDISESHVYRFTSLKMFTTKCSGAFKKGIPYLAFRGVGRDTLDQIDWYREMHLRFTRVLYDEDSELLVVKLMPGVLHEHAASSFSLVILADLGSMGLGSGLDLPLDGTGSTRFGIAGRRQKEADASFRPRSRAGRDSWPSFVIEVGVSETLSQLHCDAWFWLTQSAGLTRVVFLIKINDNDRSLIIEQWENVPQALVCASTPAFSPAKVNRVELTQGGCVGAPIVVTLANIFDVVPMGVAANATLVLSAQLLSRLYVMYWQSMT